MEIFQNVALLSWRISHCLSCWLLSSSWRWLRKLWGCLPSNGWQRTKLLQLALSSPYSPQQHLPWLPPYLNRPYHSLFPDIIFHFSPRCLGLVYLETLPPTSACKILLIVHILPWMLLHEISMKHIHTSLVILNILLYFIVGFCCWFVPPFNKYSWALITPSCCFWSSWQDCRKKLL